MTNQPYEGQPGQPYDGHGAWQGYDDPYAAQQHTQQWQGQTWETSVQPQVPGAPGSPTAAEETALLPPHPSQGDGMHTGYGEPAPTGPAYGGPAAAYGEPAPAYGGPAAAYREPAAAYGMQAGGPGPAPADPAFASTGPTAAGPVPTGAVPSGAASAAADAPEYGPATVAGNPRITDAQRARAEGRSPIIEPGMQPALLTAGLGLLLAGGAALGTYALLVPLVILQGVTAAGWFRLNGMWPARQGIALGFLGALVADAALLVSGRSPAAILGTLGVWVLLSLVLQLRSHADPDERIYGLMATVAAAALAIVAGGYLAADAQAVTVGALAVAVAALVRALPLPTPASAVAALVAAAVTGAAAGALTDLGASGALLGAGAAVCALIGHRVASYDYPSRFVHFTAGVALPLAVAAPAVYLLGRVVG